MTMNKDDKIFVFDNNVFISAAIRKSGTCAQAIVRAETLGLIISSQPIFDEFAVKILSKKIRRDVPADEAFSLIGYYNEGVEMTAVTPDINLSKDPKDNMFLDLAVTGKADLIVSGDSDLRLLRSIKGIGHVIPIITPKQFLAQYPAPETLVAPGPFSVFFKSVRPE
jgi:putative PIN family toxin of toxin-antitoxin system